jgi:hypothetical protein
MSTLKQEGRMMSKMEKINKMEKIKWTTVGDFSTGYEFIHGTSYFSGDEYKFVEVKIWNILSDIIFNKAPNSICERSLWDKFKIIHPTMRRIMYEYHNILKKYGSASMSYYGSPMRISFPTGFFKPFKKLLEDFLLDFLTDIRLAGCIDILDDQFNYKVHI